MKYFWRVSLIFIITIYIISLTIFTIFHQQFKHLSLKDDIRQSRCIVVYNPEMNKEILESANQLLKKNKNSTLIYTPFILNKEVNSIKLLKEVGIDKSKIIPDYYSTSMKDSSLFVNTIMQKEDFNDCILVSRDYEMNRLVATFEKNNPLFNFYHQAIKLNGESYLSSAKGRKMAEQEMWKYPYLWLNR